MSEVRLIDANALEKALCKMCDMRKYCKQHDNDCWAKRRIDEQPTVDAVPVVRCEKCRHGIKVNGISDGWVLCSKPYVTDTVGNMDWFCADGERR